MSQSAAASAQGKKWLREASMRRLSLFVKNKTELIGNAAQLGVGVLHPDNLEKSGLSASEIYHLEQWVAGVETGRQCMLAMLDSRLVQKTELEHLDRPTTTDKDNFKPVDLIRSLLNLPEQFLCDGGYLYESVFQRPPTSVVREALQTLVQAALEKSPSQLGIEQINLAIKQLRLNNLGDAIDGSDPTEDDGGPSVASGPKGSPAEEALRLEILIELVRIHIASMSRKAESTSGSADVKSVLSILGASQEGSASKAAGKPAPPVRLHIADIEGHLRTPLKVAFEQAGAMSAEELEGSNLLLKPYLKQLSALKAALAAELKDLQDSRAFLALGLSSEASDEAIKKAYRSLAIRLHPDKPGGDTARFQQLQDSYHEIMRKRKADSAERAAMEEVRNKYRPKPAAGKASAEGEAGAEVSTDKATDKHPRQDDVASEESGEDHTSQEAATENEASAGGDGTDEAVRDQQAPQPEASEAEEEGARPAAKEVSGAEGQEVEDQAGEDDQEEDAGESYLDEDFDVEEVMRGLDGSEDVDEVFRRLAASSKARSYASTTADAAGAGAQSSSGAKQKPVVYENEAEHAQAVVRQITELLQRIKKSAAECTQLAQLNIKWQKMLAKAMEPPCTLKDVMKVITASSGPKSLLRGTKSDLSAAGGDPVSNIDACALQQAIVPVELICDWAQQVSALAMELPNACGVRYAAAVSGNKSFIMAVERSMQLSLGALKTVLGFINTQEQLASCVRRVKDSVKLAAANPEIQDLLLEMLRTGVKSNVVTITSAVDRIVETAMAASEVREQVLNLLKEVERQERAEIKLRAMEQESRQAEDDYCEEDREALRKCREDRRNEERAARRGGGSGSEGEKEDKDKDQSDSGSLDDLKDKIRQLQVQLKVQHVQALQNMNTEVVMLQTQIINELQALPFVTSLDSLFAHNSASLLKPRGDDVNKRSPTPPPASADDSAAAPRDFKTSLLTLVAELVDSSCHAIRSDVLAASSASASTSDTASDTASAESRPLSPKELLDQHLGWVRIVLADGSTYCKTQLDAVAAALEEQQWSGSGSPTTATTTTTATTAEDGPSPSSPTPSADPTPEQSSQDVNIRLALLPDYRAKALYLASLVDLPTLQDILGPQLLQRLEEILLEGKECVSRRGIATPMTSVAVSEVVVSAESGSPESKSDECSDADGAGAAEGEGEEAADSAAGSCMNDIDEAEYTCTVETVSQPPLAQPSSQGSLFDIDEDEYVRPACLDQDAVEDSDQPLPVPPSVEEKYHSVFPPSPPPLSPPFSPKGSSISSREGLTDSECRKHAFREANVAAAGCPEGENAVPNIPSSVPV